MSKVHTLPPEIISKIAAGEVIERPASVIKELVENTLDAGADSLEIRLQQAGKTLIRVKDTGTGIAEEDIETIFLRHSTSKIVSLEDLFCIRSLGFRGEALYSISAVADITLRSRTQQQDTGWEIHLRGGEKIDLKPVAMSVGTDIEVKELFFNTPARRKFLKSNTTEMNRILNIVIPYALLHPKCRFLLSHQDKTILDLSPAENFKTRIAGTLNFEEKDLIEASHDFREQGISVHMVLGDINILRSRRDIQFIFVNNRPVQNKSVSFHMNNIYRLIFPQGSYPFFAVFIDVPAEDVDANIHPTKREVKIRDEQALCAILRQMTENALMTKGGAKQAKDTPATASRDLTSISQALSKSRSQDFSFEDKGESPAVTQKRPTEQYSFPVAEQLTIVGAGALSKPGGLKEKLTQARYIGSFLDKFLFFEAERSILVVDQHAGQERISFEKLIAQMEKSQVEVQRLLSPYLISMAPQDILAWEEAKDRLSDTGFSTSLFDEETVAVHTYPILIKDAVKAVQDILAGEDTARCDHEALARRACRSSVMAGDRMTKEQAEYQRRELLKCRDPFTCPHGRPTVIELTEDYLDKQFLRT